MTSRYFRELHSLHLITMFIQVLGFCSSSNECQWVQISSKHIKGVETPGLGQWRVLWLWRVHSGGTLLNVKVQGSQRISLFLRILPQTFFVYQRRIPKIYLDFFVGCFFHFRNHRVKTLFFLPGYDDSIENEMGLSMDGHRVRHYRPVPAPLGGEKWGPCLPPSPYSQYGMPITPTMTPTAPFLSSGPPTPSGLMGDASQRDHRTIPAQRAEGEDYDFVVQGLSLLATWHDLTAWSWSIWNSGEMKCHLKGTL